VICDIYEIVNFMKAQFSSVEWTSAVTEFPGRYMG